MEKINTVHRFVTHGETVMTAGADSAFDYILTDPVGLHARPAAELVKLAKTFPAEITLSANGKTASAKSVFEMMALNASKGTTVRVEASGEKSADALAAVRRYLAEKL